MSISGQQPHLLAKFVFCGATAASVINRTWRGVHFRVNLTFIYLHSPVNPYETGQHDTFYNSEYLSFV